MGVVDVVKNHTPWVIRRVSREAKRELRWAYNAKHSVKDVFADVYARNLWGNRKAGFYSGPGSESVAADVYVANIAAFIADHQVTSIVDLGCGDFRVAQRILDGTTSYLGIDIVAPLVEENTKRYANGQVSFRCLDIIAEELPPGGLCLIREVFQHLSNAEILQVIPKLRNFRFVIYTDYQPGSEARCWPNRDIAHGADTRIWRDSALFLDQPPFNVPMQLLFEAPASTTLRHPGERIRSYILWP